MDDHLFNFRAPVRLSGAVIGGIGLFLPSRLMERRSADGRGKTRESCSVPQSMLGAWEVCARVRSKLRIKGERSDLRWFGFRRLLSTSITNARPRSESLNPPKPFLLHKVIKMIFLTAVFLLLGWTEKWNNKRPKRHLKGALIKDLEACAR